MGEGGLGKQGDSGVELGDTLPWYGDSPVGALLSFDSEEIELPEDWVGPVMGLVVGSKVATYATGGEPFVVTTSLNKAEGGVSALGGGDVLSVVPRFRRSSCLIEPGHMDGRGNNNSAEHLSEVPQCLQSSASTGDLSPLLGASTMML